MLSIYEINSISYHPLLACPPSLLHELSSWLPGEILLVISIFKITICMLIVLRCSWSAILLIVDLNSKISLRNSAWTFCVRTSLVTAVVTITIAYLCCKIVDHGVNVDSQSIPHAPKLPQSQLNHPRYLLCLNWTYWDRYFAVRILEPKPLRSVQCQNIWTLWP